MFITHRRRIVERAAKYRLPSIFGERGSVQAGGLMFYGANLKQSIDVWAPISAADVRSWGYSAKHMLDLRFTAFAE